MSVQDKVRELGARVKHNQKFLDQERENKKRRDALAREIREAPDMVQFDFFCRNCDRDVISMGYKRVHKDGMGTYLGQCPNGHGLVRYITEKWRDPYWELSHKVRHDREKYADDMLTPDNPRFKVVYPDVHKRLEAEKEAYYQAQYERDPKEIST